MSHQNLRRSVAVLFGLVLALGAGLAALLLRADSSSEEDDIARLMSEPEIREAAVRRLVDSSTGTWDAYADPDVGRVLQANLEGRDFRGASIYSNSLGMREEFYQLEKPDTYAARVVLLGDSYVFGYGVAAEDRLGVHLERLLEEGREGKSGRIEVLHLALSSWNLAAECSYLRRQLTALDPDLVLQFATSNDLEDIMGVRGFGKMSGFSPQARERGNSLMRSIVPQRLSKTPLDNFLIEGLDWESRTRYAHAARYVDDLARALERRGTPYQLIFHWSPFNGLARRLLAGELSDDSVAFVAQVFTDDPDNWNGPRDRHWNPGAHERMALMLYGLIVERDLLPELELRSISEAVDALEEIHGAGVREVAAEVAPSPRIRSYLTMPPEDQDMTRQVYLGIDDEGNASPFVSVILARGGGSSLTVAGEAMGRTEIEGGTGKVFVDEFEVGRIELGDSAAFPYEFELPAGVAGREFLTVRFECDDWIYTDVRSSACTSFRLSELRIR